MLPLLRPGLVGPEMAGDFAGGWEWGRPPRRSRWPATGALTEAPPESHLAYPAPGCRCSFRFLTPPQFTPESRSAHMDDVGSGACIRFQIYG